MDPRTLLDLLVSQRPAGLPPGELAIRPVQENVFQLKSVADTGSLADGMVERHFFVKWIAGDNLPWQNELRIARIFKRLKALTGPLAAAAPPLIFEQAVEGGVIAGWAWIKGHDLRELGRELLPAAFARLGQLHKAMRNNGEIVSPLGTKSYANVRALLAEEAYRLTAPFAAPSVGPSAGSSFAPSFVPSAAPSATPPLRERCLAILARLEAGYPTLIHGDMHPGNFIAAPDRIWIVDWSYACNSLNLFDLDYVQSIALPANGAAWTVINPPEALDVLRAYFQAAGLEHVDVLKVQQAVMVWNQLRTYDNCVKNGYRAEAAQAREQVLKLVNL